jgi:hypothetical protein
MTQFIKVFLIAAALGLIVFFWTASQVTSIEQVDTNTASFRFRAVLEQFEDTRSMLTMDGGGRVTRRTRRSKALIPVVPTGLKILAWRGSTIGLVEVHIPMWFLRMKGPAINYLLKETKFDLQSWGLTVEELQDWGPGVVLDHQSAAGERVLIWTE